MLVVFYSHTGNTRTIARHIQALTGCDLLDLEPVTPYPRDYDTVVSQAKKEKQQGFLPPLKNPLDMVSRYDVILVGSPSWWGTFAGPVRTFLSTAALDGKTLISFITHEGSGLGSAPADLRRLCPSAKTGEGLAIRGSRVDGARQQVESWLRTDADQFDEGRYPWTKCVPLKRKGGRMSPAALFVTIPCFWKKDA